MPTILWILKYLEQRAANSTNTVPNDAVPNDATLEADD